MSTFVAIILDDRDPTIQYTGTWTKGGDPAVEYLGTTTFGLRDPSTFATLTFIGTGVTVFGSLVSNTVQVSNFSIDGGIPTTFTSTSSSITRYSQPFFTVGEGSLSPGVNHTLVVTPVQTRLIIDMITVDVTIPPPSTTSGVGNQAQGSGSTRTSTPVGAIIGGVLGGLGLLCMVAFMVVYLRRQKAAQGKSIPIFSSNANIDSPTFGREPEIRQSQLAISPYDLTIASPYAPLPSSTEGGNVATNSPSSSSGYGTERRERGDQLGGAVGRKSNDAGFLASQSETTSDPPPGYNSADMNR